MSKPKQSTLEEKVSNDEQCQGLLFAGGNADSGRNSIAVAWSPTTLPFLQDRKLD